MILVQATGGGPCCLRMPRVPGQRLLHQVPSLEDGNHRFRMSQLWQPRTHTPFDPDGEAGAPPHRDKKVGSPAAKPWDAQPHQASRSSRLLVENGLIRPSYPGNFAYMPLALRSMDKLQRLLEHHLRPSGAQKLLLPTLTEGRLWEKTGRLQKMGGELLVAKDRADQTLVFSPTHEEAVTKMLADLSPLTYRSLPLRLFQISTKFRDEMRPRFGLVRSREFVMKDLYSFDVDESGAAETYRIISDAYSAFFRDLGVAAHRVLGDSGAMGGSQSHEYHLATPDSPVGQDTIVVCPAAGCGRGWNSELGGTSSKPPPGHSCPRCGPGGPEAAPEMVETKGIEVAHTFLLGLKYSETLKAHFLGLDGKARPMYMGCYGVGVSRLMSSCVEVLSSDRQIRWPRKIAPFSACIICPKPGSHEAGATVDALDLYDRLGGQGRPFEEDVLLDDRDRMTVGKKLREALKMGYPCVVLFGKESANSQDPKVELYFPSTGLDDPGPVLVPLSQVVERVLATLAGPDGDRTPPPFR